jgi:hypothetical protein
VDQHVEASLVISVEGADARCGLRSTPGREEHLVGEKLLKVAPYLLMSRFARILLQRSTAIGAELVERIGHI